MSVIKISGQWQGVFQKIEKLSDRYRCDNVDFPFSVVGDQCEISSDNSLAPPLPEPQPIPEPVPQVISMRQCCQQLLAMDLLDDVEAAIGQMDRSAQMDWQRAQEAKRDWPLVIQMQSLFQWTDEQMDKFFVEANKQ